MKTTWIDYLLSSIVITALVLAAVGCVALCVQYTRLVFGEYHVLVDLALGLVLYGLFSAALVRAMLRLRPIRPGTYGTDSPVFTRWKLLTVTYRLGQGALRPFVPVFLQPLLEGLFGARIGRDVALGGVIDDPYAVSIGDGSVLGNASLVSANYINGGRLTCGVVRIGRNVTVGANCVVYPDTEIGDGATLMVASCLTPGTRVPAGETWRGNPARKWMQPAGGRST